MVIAVAFSGCGPTVEDIMKKYNAYSEAGADANKAGVSLEVQEISLGTLSIINAIIVCV